LKGYPAEVLRRAAVANMEFMRTFDPAGHRALSCLIPSYEALEKPLNETDATKLLFESTLELAHAGDFRESIFFRFLFSSFWFL